MNGFVPRIAFAILVVAATLAQGCAAERAPINRVQADALSKHFFVGPDLSDPHDDPEFYMASRIIDVSLGAPTPDWTALESELSFARVKWEITETELIARLTYERVQNSDHRGSRTTNDGQVLAIFAIQSQFDIRRDYNPATGEELNIVTENTTDRPWYQREYFRVDWSTNKIPDAYGFDPFAEAQASGVKYDPSSYYVADPSSPDAPVFAPDDGYFDVTTKVFASPQLVNTPYGTYPFCYFSSGPTVNCNPTEYKVRLSFKTVTDTDYAPTDYSPTEAAAFGWITAERFGYDRNYGILDDQWHRFAMRYNIWQKSHVAGTACAVDAWSDGSGTPLKFKAAKDGSAARDPATGLPVPAAASDSGATTFTLSAIGRDVHRDDDGDGTEDECQFANAAGTVQNAGSRCDEFSHKCTIPLYARKLRTIPWYYGDVAPPELFAATARALGSWNVAIKRAAQLGKVAEASRLASPVDLGPMLTSEDDLTADGGKTVTDVFVLCHNPVVAGDNAACGDPGLHARIGDLRYNIVNVINNPQSPSPWGLEDNAMDPLTGETIQSGVNIWGAVTDLAAQGVEDELRWVNGEISDAQISGGQYLRDWVSADKLGATPFSPAILDAREVAKRVHAIDTSVAKLNGMKGAPPMPGALYAAQAAANLAKTLGPSLDSQFEATRQQLIGSQWESRLITPNMMRLARLDPSTPVAGDDKAAAQASPLRGLNPNLRTWANAQISGAFARRGSCVMAAPEPDSYVGLARQAQQLFPLPDPMATDYATQKHDRDQKLHQWLREQFHETVLAHEMGHSMGLTHNFTGSFDALNYHTEYWQLRTQNGKEHFCGYKGKPTDPLDATTAHTDGHDCVGPRWVDPVTDDEVNGLIWKWGSSTVMDYPGDQAQDTMGIGPYDKAAMRFGYADLVDVENSIRLPQGKPNVGQSGPLGAASELLWALDGFYGFSPTIANSHYSQYADKYNLLGTCAPAASGVAPNGALSSKCSGPDLAYVSRRDMLTVDKIAPSFTSQNPSFVANFGADKQGRVRHPYMFGDDRYADLGNISVFRFDAGADPYEQFQFLISRYEDRYIFNNFRRDRVSFDPRTAVEYTLHRYWDQIQLMTKSLALGSEVFPASDLSDPTRLLPLVLGAADGFKMFVRAITRPEPGPYSIDPSAGPQPFGTVFSTFYLQPPTSTVNVSAGKGEGRFLGDEYDNTKGYFSLNYPLQVGSAHEKYYAIQYLNDARNPFVPSGQQDFLDGRYKNVSYATLYPQQVRRFFSAILQNDSFTFAPYVLANANSPVGQNTPVQYLPWDKYDVTDPTSTSLEYPSGAVLLDPLVGWEEQYPTLIAMFEWGPTSQSMDLVDQLRIFSTGGSDTVAIPIDQQVHYRDPLTGIVYVARNYGQETVNSAIGHTVAKSSGARMIQYANQLAKQAYVVSSVDPQTGELSYQMDAGGSPVVNQTVANAVAAGAQLKLYSANLDVVRQLTAFFGYGPLGH